MNLNPLVHKITIAIGLITMAFTFFGKFLPFSEELKIAIVGFIGALGSFVKTFQEPPAKKEGGGPPSGGVTSIVGGIGAVLVALFLTGGCSSAQSRAVGPAILDIADAVDEHAANVLEFVAPFLPDNDHRLAALRAARAARDFGRFYDLARPLVQGIASGGNDVPRDVAADLALGAAAAKSIEGFARALDGRDPETGEKKAAP